MNLFDMIDKAIALYDQASELMERAKPSLDNLTSGESKNLTEAKERLQKAMGRAQDAHDSLEEAIHQQIGN